MPFVPILFYQPSGKGCAGDGLVQNLEIEDILTCPREPMHPDLSSLRGPELLGSDTHHPL